MQLFLVRILIHNNPVRAGIVFKAEHYEYSSAWNNGDEGLIPIGKLYVHWKTYEYRGERLGTAAWRDAMPNRGPNYGIRNKKS
ncbi:MAG TPA: hypothetical protein VFF27_07435 [Bacteroidia bacterium]|nr:hypothetical protein [Bacteroidia bacterium]